jgi:hypothetical protein
VSTSHALRSRNLALVDRDMNRHAPHAAAGFVRRNVGLGHVFLRHVERTKLLVLVVDAAGSEGRDPLQDLLALQARPSPPRERPSPHLSDLHAPDSHVRLGLSRGPG